MFFRKNIQTHTYHLTHDKSTSLQFDYCQFVLATIPVEAPNIQIEVYELTSSKKMSLEALTDNIVPL
jgi:hypothetical protein